MRLSRRPRRRRRGPSRWRPRRATPRCWAARRGARCSAARASTSSTRSQVRGAARVRKRGKGRGLRLWARTQCAACTRTRTLTVRGLLTPSCGAARRPAQQPVAGRVLRVPGVALHQHLRRLGRQERRVCAAAAAAGARAGPAPACRPSCRRPWALARVRLTLSPFGSRSPHQTPRRWPRSTARRWWRARSCRASPRRPPRATRPARSRRPAAARWALGQGTRAQSGVTPCRPSFAAACLGNPQSHTGRGGRARRHTSLRGVSYSLHTRQRAGARCAKESAAGAALTTRAHGERYRANWALPGAAPARRLKGPA